jgi:hypothetical protein
MRKLGKLLFWASYAALWYEAWTHFQWFEEYADREVNYVTREELEAAIKRPRFNEMRF